MPLVLQQPDLSLGTDRNPPAAHGDTHRLIELMKRERKPAIGRTDGNQLAGLIRGDQERDLEPTEDVTKGGGMTIADLPPRLSALGFLRWKAVHELGSFRSREDCS